ncbi:MAG: hypothetical protein WBB69_01895 [Anaerolineales bacterium]
MTNYISTPEKRVLSQKRPWTITGLCVLVILISLYHFFGFIQVLLNQQILETLPLNVSPLYLAGNGLVWGVVGLILVWGLWKGYYWAWKAGLVLPLCFAVLFWIDLIWLAEPDRLQSRWLINLELTILGLSSVFISLALPSSRIFFSRNPAKID